MVLGNWLYWLAWIGAIALNAMMVYVAWRAWFGDRHKHARRCPCCWYDLSGTPGLRCGECGHEAIKESQLHRVRRRPRLAALAILVAVSSILALRWQMDGVRWTTYVPTWALLWSMPLIAEPGNDLYAELNMRIGRGQCTREQVHDFVERAAGGDWWRSPPDDDWIESYGNALAMHEPALTGDAAIEAMLLDIPPSVQLRMRETWPTLLAPTVGLNLGEWWPVDTRVRITIAPAFSGADGAPIAPLRAERTATRLFSPVLTMQLPPLAEGRRELEFEVSIDRITRADARAAETAALDHPDQPVGQPWKQVSTQRITLPVIVESIEAFSPPEPVSSPVLDQTVAMVFPGVASWGSGPSPVRMFFVAEHTFISAFDDTAIGAHVDLLYNGELTRRLSIWWMAGTIATERRPSWESLELRPDLLATLDPNDPAWTLRITGDPQLALRAGLAAKAWSGTASVPLTVQPREGDAPPKAWTIEQPSLDVEFESQTIAP